MKLKILITALTVAIVSATAHAEVSLEEASRLGKDLTLFGAEKAGNKDGTIPEYTGGLTKPPADYKNDGVYVDPFKNEKPLFSITQANMAQYADKLADGQKYLLKKYPDYRIDVYPTHRTASFPQHVLDATVKNATRTKTTDGGIGIEGAEGGLPFPIPKNGYEAMWNHLIRYEGDVMEFTQLSYYVNQSGGAVMTGFAAQHLEAPYYQPDSADRTTLYSKFYADASAPSALAGQQFMWLDALDVAKHNRRAWTYIPGQRRVKLAPEFTYDTPHPASGGSVTFDDVNIFSGAMDRYSFKLVGKKEMYIPYSLYKHFHETPTTSSTLKIVATPKFSNPDYTRWELHRVWVVEAELLPGKRHVYKKRVFYWDEDGFGAGMSDQYDSAGKLFRHGMSLPMQLYDKAIPFAFPFLDYDFSANVYVVSGRPVSPILAGMSGPSSARRWTPNQWSQEAMANRGVR